MFADGNGLSAVGFLNPDNPDTSSNSLMVQDDRSNARIWRYDFDTRGWKILATVNDRRGESSGIWVLRYGLGMSLGRSMCGPAAAMKAGEDEEWEAELFQRKLICTTGTALVFP